MPRKRSCQTTTEVWAESRARVRSSSRGRARWRTWVGGGRREAIVRQVVTWHRWEENWRVGVRGSQRNRQRMVRQKNTFLSLALLAPTSRRQKDSTETSNLRKNGELKFLRGNMNLWTMTPDGSWLFPSWKSPAAVQDQFWPRCNFAILPSHTFAAVCRSLFPHLCVPGNLPMVRHS